MSPVVVSITGATVFPVPPHRRLRSRQAAIVEEMAAEALHGGRFAGRPHAGAVGEVDVADRSAERITGSRAWREIAPRDGRARTLRQREVAVCRGDLDTDLHR